MISLATKEWMKFLNEKILITGGGGYVIFSINQ